MMSTVVRMGDHDIQYAPESRTIPDKNSRQEAAVQDPKGTRRDVMQRGNVYAVQYPLSCSPRSKVDGQ
jgi:hypothetical protein